MVETWNGPSLIQAARVFHPELGNGTDPVKTKLHDHFWSSKSLKPKTLICQFTKYKAPIIGSESFSEQFSKRQIVNYLWVTEILLTSDIQGFFFQSWTGSPSNFPAPWNKLKKIYSLGRDKTYKCKTRKLRKLGQKWHSNLILTNI